MSERAENKYFNFEIPVKIICEFFMTLKSQLYLLKAFAGERNNIFASYTSMYDHLLSVLSRVLNK